MDVGHVGVRNHPFRAQAFRSQANEAVARGDPDQAVVISDAAQPATAAPAAFAEVRPERRRFDFLRHAFAVPINFDQETVRLARMGSAMQRCDEDAGHTCRSFYGQAMRHCKRTNREREVAPTVAFFSGPP